MAKDEAALRQLALDLLARREHSRKELEQKLTRRNYPDSMIATTLDELEQTGALAATRFAESFIRSRVAKGQGPLRIRAELTQRGLRDADYREALETAGIDWVALARRVRRKRFGNERPESVSERARQHRFLEYRGFTMEQANAAMRSDDEPA